MRIRRHHPADFAELAELRWLLKAEDPAQGDGAAFRLAYCDALRQAEALGDTVHWVIEDRARLVGALTIRVVRKELSPGRAPGAWGYLTNTFVREDMRGQGHGSALLRSAIDWAGEAGLELLIVWPSARSYPFYRRAGFRGASDPLELTLPG